VVVAAGEEDVVRIILDGVEFTSSTGSPFVVQSANEAIVYLEDGSTNTLTDATTYADQGDGRAERGPLLHGRPDHRRDRFVDVNGKYNDGIVSKDGLVLAAGKVTVDAADDGIRGKDYAVLLDGAYQVTAAGTASSRQRHRRGPRLAPGQRRHLTSAPATTASRRTTPEDRRGTVTVGRNPPRALRPSTSPSAGGRHRHLQRRRRERLGRSLHFRHSQRRRRDGRRRRNGGRLHRGGLRRPADHQFRRATAWTPTATPASRAARWWSTGPLSSGNGALDVNGELAVTGGTVAAAGSAGMAVTPSDTSTQSGVQVTLGSSVPAGTVIQVADSSGKVVAAFVTTKATASLVFSSAAINDGEEYTVYTGGTATVGAGLGEGSLDGAKEQGTVTAGEYTAAQGPGGGGRR
jgi:hypothetical protein